MQALADSRSTAKPATAATRLQRPKRNRPVIATRAVIGIAARTPPAAAEATSAPVGPDVGSAAVPHVSGFGLGDGQPAPAPVGQPGDAVELGVELGLELGVGRVLGGDDLGVGDGLGDGFGGGGGALIV